LSKLESTLVSKLQRLRERKQSRPVLAETFCCRTFLKLILF
jgi:hypothetical protein